ncbi:uncharacterized protein LOC127708789 [Mytilus californianus]|uniref:uncharacterized protein LOC127708789 n=1 Tax=Mytilus californianus TaxID=6549 RepID=UPI0022456EDC|nr:uncharacterized protein LOC127708789 [Mytilus californianus]
MHFQMTQKEGKVGSTPWPIRRLDENTMKSWSPSQSAVVCKAHFTEKDYVQETVHGHKPTIQRLKSTANPSLFSWTKQETESSAKRKIRAVSCENKRTKLDEYCSRNLEESFDCKVGFPEEVIHSADRIYDCPPPTAELMLSFTDGITQTPSMPIFSAENFEMKTRDTAMHFYTGLELYTKFLFVLTTLGPTAHCLRYIYFQIDRVSFENQFFYDFDEIDALYNQL